MGKKNEGKMFTSSTVPSSPPSEKGLISGMTLDEGTTVENKYFFHCFYFLPTQLILM
jgi:hypothetical protein